MEDNKIPVTQKLSGLQKICKIYGSIKIQGVLWVWDYANECAVLETEMPMGGERWKVSEKKKYDMLREIKDRNNNTE